MLWPPCFDRRLGKTCKLVASRLRTSLPQRRALQGSTVRAHSQAAATATGATTTASASAMRTSLSSPYSSGGSLIYAQPPWDSASGRPGPAPSPSAAWSALPTRQPASPPTLPQQRWGLLPASGTGPSQPLRSRFRGFGGVTVGGMGSGMGGRKLAWGDLVARDAQPTAPLLCMPPSAAKPAGAAPQQRHAAATASTPSGGSSYQRQMAAYRQMLAAEAAAAAASTDVDASAVAADVSPAAAAAAGAGHAAGGQALVEGAAEAAGAQASGSAVAAEVKEHVGAAPAAPPVAQQQATAAATTALLNPAAAGGSCSSTVDLSDDGQGELRGIRAAAGRIAGAARLLAEAESLSACQLAELGLASSPRGGGNGAGAWDRLQTRMASVAAALGGWLRERGSGSVS